MINLSILKFKGLVLSVTLIALICSLGLVTTASARDGVCEDGSGQFDYAGYLMDTENYDSASREYARLIEECPGSSLVPDAQLKMSEALLNLGRYYDAADELRLFIANFSDSALMSAAEDLLTEAETFLDGGFAPNRADRPVIYTRHMKAVQVALFEGRNYDEVNAELRRIKDAGIDTVILRVFHNAYDRYYPFVSNRLKTGVYFKTDSAPVIEDMLGSVIPLAHANGLKIFAWMTTRYADYGVEGDMSIACKAYDFRSGKAAGCKGLDIFNERAVKRLAAIYSDLAKYPIDGVLFQDDLMLRHNEGFGPDMEARYFKDTGGIIDPAAFYNVEPDGNVHYTRAFWKWAAWKNERLLDVADRLRAAVKVRRPKAMFAINLMYENLVKAPYALAWLSQSLNASIKRDYDYYSIMAYHRQMEEELGISRSESAVMIAKMAVDALGAVKDPDRVLIKLQAVDWSSGKPLPESEITGLIRDVRSTMTGTSLAVIPYRSGLPLRELSGADGLASAR